MAEILVLTFSNNLNKTLSASFSMMVMYGQNGQLTNPSSPKYTFKFSEGKQQEKKKLGKLDMVKIL